MNGRPIYLTLIFCSVFILSACIDDKSDSSTSTPDQEPVTETPTESTTPIEPVAASVCAPLPVPTGNVITVGVDQVNDLSTIVSNARAGDTILLEDGHYQLNGAYLWFASNNVTLRSKSGNADAVILDGAYVSTELITVAASDVTIAEISLIKAYTHAIHVTSSDAGDTLNTRIYRVNIVDPRQQAIKINPHNSAGFYPDNGVISCSTMQLTDKGRPHVDPVSGGCYTGGIDAHQAANWIIKDNLIEGFWCPSGLSEHAIHLWRGSRDTLVERNTLLNNARGIGFGLANSGTARQFDDAACPEANGAYVDHYNGIIRNNVIVANETQLFNSMGGFDCGVCLWSACKAKVLHNTIVATDNNFSSVEWRFSGSQGIEISNNIVTHTLREREDSSATLQGNVTQAELSLFRDVALGDVHLVPTATAAIDQAVSLDEGLITLDIDQQPRTGVADIGADEFISE